MTGEQLVEQTMRKLGDDPSAEPGQQYYGPTEILAALNLLQRLFVIMTLCLERTRTETVSTAYLQAMTLFGDWMVPLRVRIHGGAKLKPSTFSDFAALDNAWSLREGTPTRYAVAGFGLLGFYKHAETDLDFTYARSPIDLTLTTSPEIPEEYHPALMDGVQPLLRVKEGQQEWQKVLPLWAPFMEEVQRLNRQVRARNIELGYDRVPLELRRFDLSQLLKKARKPNVG